MQSLNAQSWQNYTVHGEVVECLKTLRKIGIFVKECSSSNFITNIEQRPYYLIILTQEIPS